MGYIFLTASLFAGAIKGYCGERISGKTSNVQSALSVNFLRMLFCIAIGFLFVLFDGGAQGLRVNGEMLGIAVCGAVSTSAFLVSWLLAVRSSAYMSVEAFVAMGLLVPILMSLACYGESVRISQALGLGLLICSVIAMSLYNNQVKRKLTWKTLLLLAVVGLSSGFADFSQKLFVKNAQGETASVFNFYLYVFSAVILGAVYGICRVRERKTTTERTPFLQDKRTLCRVAVMATCLFCNSYFKTLAADRLSAVQLYPLSQGAALILSFLMSTFLFKQKPKLLSVIGITVLFIGLLFINVFTF